MPTELALVLLLSIVAIIVTLFSTTMALPLRALVIAVAVLSSAVQFGFNYALDDGERAEIVQRVREIVYGKPPPADFTVLARRCQRLFRTSAGDRVGRALLEARKRREDLAGDWLVVWDVGPHDPEVPAGAYRCSGRGEKILALSTPDRVLFDKPDGAGPAAADG